MLTSCPWFSVTRKITFGTGILFPKDTVALYEWFILPTTITCRPSRSSFLFLFVSFLCSQKLYIYCHLRETFLCTPSFLYMTNFLCIRIRTLFLYVTRSIYKPYSCSKISFFFCFFQHTPVVYTKVSLYTLVAHTHKNFFSHIIYTHKILLYTFSFTYIKNSFLFFVYIDTTFVHNALFLALSWFLFILFLGRHS